MKRDSPSGTGKEPSHGTTTEPSKGTNHSTTPPNKDAAPTSTQSTTTALTGMVPYGDGSTLTTEAKAQHAIQPNVQKSAAASSLTKTGAGNKSAAKDKTITLDTMGSAKKGQCNARPASSTVGAKLQRAPAVTNPKVQNTQENTATTSNSTSPTKSTVSRQAATKSNAKTSVVKACPNSVNAAVGARLAAAPTVRPAGTGAMLTTTKVTDSKQSTIGDGSKSVETSKGNMKVKSNTKLTAAAATPAVTTATKAKSGTNVTKPVTASVHAKTSSTTTTKQVSPKPPAKTIGATKTTTTSNQSVGAATKKPAAKAKPTTTKGSGKLASVHQPASSKPSTTTGGKLDVNKVTPSTSTAGSKTVSSPSGIAATTTTNKTAAVVTCQTTTTTVTTKTPSRTKTTSSAPSAMSAVKHSTKTGTINAKPTTNSDRAKTEPNRAGVHRTLSARNPDTSQMINAQAAATTCTQGVSTASGSHAKIAESSPSTAKGSASEKSRPLLGGEGTAADRKVGTAAVAENKAYVMSPTVAQSQLEVTHSIDVAMVTPPTLSLPDTTRCDKVDAVVSSRASQSETIHRKDPISSANSSKVRQPVDDLEKEVIYSEEQTVSLAMVTTKSDVVDMPSGDIVQEDNTRGSLLTDRLEAVPLSPVSHTFINRI